MSSQPGPPLCVLCRRNPAEREWRPFCSQRCKLQDLARWADGTYRVPGDPLPEPFPEPDSTDKPNG
ncbi:MAG: DNA gyrase inhibitor YacG [Luteitalea sp.]|nr:DNA gyrase inhibitor YacG [Luteitalea sp.]